MLNRDFLDMLSALSAEHVEYLIVGAYALGAHGLPRATKDIDIWVHPTRENAVRVMRALERFGRRSTISASTISPASKRSSRLAYRRDVIDILTELAPDIDFAAAWATRLVANFGELPAPVLSRETLIRAKRAAGRPQDLVDVQRLEAAMAAEGATPPPRRPSRGGSRPRGAKRSRR